jgi:hypothetical protein
MSWEYEYVTEELFQERKILKDKVKFAYAQWNDCFSDECSEYWEGITLELEKSLDLNTAAIVCDDEE